MKKFYFLVGLTLFYILSSCQRSVDVDPHKTEEEIEENCLATLE